MLQPAPPKPHSRAKRLLTLGALGLLFGTGPLVAVIIAAELGLLADPNPNPIGLGLLAMCTFYPSLLALVAGAIWWLGERMSARGGRPSRM